MGLQRGIERAFEGIDMSTLLMVVMVPRVCACVKAHQIEHFKCVESTVYPSYLRKAVKCVCVYTYTHTLRHMLHEK